MINSLAAIHGHLQREIQEFIDDAETTSLLTIPWLNPRGEKRRRRLPSSHEGAQGVISLSAWIDKSSMPDATNWFKLDLTEQAWSTLSRAIMFTQGPEAWKSVEAAITDALKARVKLVMRALRKRAAKSRMLKAIQRAIVEGQVGFFMPETGESIQMWPMRSLGIERHDGRVIRMTIKYVPLLDPNKEHIDPEKMDERKFGYIYVDWTTGIVMTQDGDDDPVVSPDMKPWMFFVGSTEIPDIEDWARGYAYQYLKLLDQIDHASTSLNEAMSTAAWNMMIIDENSSLAQHRAEIQESPSNRIWVGDKDSVNWVTSGIKLQDWGFVGVLKQGWKADLAQVFALGIKDRPSSGSPSSATEIIEITNELQTQTGATVSAIDETIMRPMINAELQFAEMREPLIDLIGDLVNTIRRQVREQGERTPEVLDILGDLDDLDDVSSIEIMTGQQVAENQRGLTKLLTEVLPVIHAADPSVRVDGLVALEMFTDTIPFPTDGLFFRQQPPAMPPEETAQDAEFTEGEPEDVTVQTPGGPQNAGLQSRVQPGPPLLT